MPREPHADTGQIRSADPDSGSDQRRSLGIRTIRT